MLARLVQHAEMIDVFSNKLKAPPSGLVIPWDSYDEFWSALPNIPDSTRELVMTNLPTLDELVDLAQAKDFWQALKEASSVSEENC